MRPRFIQFHQKKRAERKRLMGVTLALALVFGGVAAKKRSRRSGTGGGF